MFGPETNARYGSGRNYIAYFVFTGPVDPATGMLINISEIKERAGKVLRDGFDHKFLNQDNPSFRESSADCRKRCPSALFRCRAAVFRRGSKTVRLSFERITRAQRDLLFHRRLRSELLVRILSGAQNDVAASKPEENVRLFGPATAPHGHNYRCRLTFRAEQLEPETAFGPIR